MGARHLAQAPRFHRDLTAFGESRHMGKRPALESGIVVDDAFGKRNSSAAGLVEFACVVDLGDPKLIAHLAAHDPRQDLVHMKCDIHSQAEVRRAEHRALLVLANAADLAKLVIPARGAHHHRYFGLQAVENMGDRRIGPAEFYGHIRARQGFRRERIR